MSYVLGLDIGTTSTIGIAIRPEGEVAGLAKRPVDLYSENVGWAEENPEQWWSNVREIITELLANGIDPAEIQAIGVTGMLPAVILLDEAGRLLRPSIQQSDARCGSEVEDLKREVDAAAFVSRAGNVLNQQLVAPKLRWIEKHEPDVFRRIATVFGSYDYIDWRLTAGRAVEKDGPLEAASWMLGGSIADDLVALAHHSAVRFAGEVGIARDSQAHFSRSCGWKRVDQGTRAPRRRSRSHCVCFGRWHHSDRRCSSQRFGGSVDILIATDQPVADPRMYLDYHLVPGLYMPNGCMATGGTALNWFVSTFATGDRAEAQAAGISVHELLDRKAAAVPAGADGLTVLPYFLGEKTDSRSFARALFWTTLSHTLGHLWRTAEGYAYALAHHIGVFHDVGCATTRPFASMADPTASLDADRGDIRRSQYSSYAVIRLLPWRMDRSIGAGLACDWCGISRSSRWTPWSGLSSRMGTVRGGYRVLQPIPSCADSRKSRFERLAILRILYDTNWQVRSGGKGCRRHWRSTRYWIRRRRVERFCRRGHRHY
jgi:xylulokinase